ncbi:hypothetical protein B0H10DRAFT_2207073 [Mycena sp. CBHHK59/15]|nr:hypothetical protein B0H10DRAFT_2207073 [Mycena sp. CBHHK59/15]
MKNPPTTPRRKSVAAGLFATPPMRRPLCVVRPRKTLLPMDAPPPVPTTPKRSDFDDDDDEAHTLTASGDISMSCPYYMPGAASALSPAPRAAARVGLRPQRARPPARRLVSVGKETYKLRTLTAKGSVRADETVRAVARGEVALEEMLVPLPRSADTSDTSMSSASDESMTLDTPQARFLAFMSSRDLTRSPKKQSSAVRVQRSSEVPPPAQIKKSVTPSVPPPPSKPLRGYARLPPRPPIPDWSGMDVDA